jgi:hypothetical protein
MWINGLLYNWEYLRTKDTQTFLILQFQIKVTEAEKPVRAYVIRGTQKA